MAGMLRRVPVGIVGVVALAGALVLSQGSGGAAAPPAQAAPDLGAGIFAGSCRKHEPEATFALTAPAKPEGERVRGLPAVSETQLTATMAALQSEPHVVLVYTGKPERGVACGEIHTTTSADGSTLATGLFEQNSSLYTGIAVLVARDGETVARVYVSRALTGGFGVAGGSGSSEPEVTDTVSIVLSEHEIVADQTEFTVGSTVQFDVENKGEERHELVLEEEDAVEEPLRIDDETQAETEDIAPEGKASFVYTFEDAGTFQLADHIGENFKQGMVLEIEVSEGS